MDTHTRLIEAFKTLTKICILVCFCVVLTKVAITVLVMR